MKDETEREREIHNSSFIIVFYLPSSELYLIK